MPIPRREVLTIAPVEAARAYAQHAEPWASLASEWKFTEAGRMALNVWSSHVLEAEQLVGPPLDRIGKPEQRGGAFGRSGPRPGREGSAGSSHSLVHLLGRGLRQLQQRLATGRVEDAFGLACAGVELATD